MRPILGYRQNTAILMFQAQFVPFDLKSYHVFKQIGKGQFGKVFLATDKNNFEVAIKQISKQELKLSRKRQELFETQRTILTKAKNENVVRMYEFFETPEYHYLVMEYCKYGDLHDYIKQKPNSTLTEEEAVEFLMQILNGFKGLHEILVIHRDIKLRNILVAENDKIKIADFGLSKISEEGVATTIVGTPYTKAPEVFSGKKYDNRADIWSLGVIFYQMLFRLSYPYTAKNEKTLFDNIKQGKTIDFHAHGISISQQVEDLIRRMLTPDPKKRITWREISQHKVILKYNQKAKKDMTKVLNTDYYEKIEKYMDDYNEQNIKLLMHFKTLVGLQKARNRNVEFCKINTIYYEYLTTKWMKTLFSQIREVIQTCLEISSIQQALNEDQLKLQEQQIEFYYQQALYNLQLYLLERNLQGRMPDLQTEIPKPIPDRKLFHSYSLRLYRNLQSKIIMFQQVPILQKVVLEQMRNILFTLQGYQSEYSDTVEGLTLLNRELYEKFKDFH